MYTVTPKVNQELGVQPFRMTLKSNADTTMLPLFNANFVAISDSLNGNGNNNKSRDRYNSNIMQEGWHSNTV